MFQVGGRVVEGRAVRLMISWTHRSLDGFSDWLGAMPSQSRFQGGDMDSLKIEGSSAPLPLCFDPAIPQKLRAIIGDELASTVRPKEALLLGSQQRSLITRNKICGDASRNSHRQLREFDRRSDE